MTKEERQQHLKERLSEMRKSEEALWEQGICYIGGMDEVGRGPLAGPVVAACVVLPQEFDLLGVDDSKKLTEKKRESLYDEILNRALAFGIGEKGPEVIDQVNILEATKLAMLDAVEAADAMLQKKCGGTVEHVLIDALHLDALEKPQQAIVKGDSKSVSIAAASIVAKVTRDRKMVEFAEIYPGYGFERNKGYGTKAHYEGIREYGITPLHRRSFLKNFNEKHGVKR